MAAFSEVDADVIESKKQEENEREKIDNINVSTVSYMYDLANQPTSGIKRCLVERHSSTYPRKLFSIRFGVIGNDDNENYSRLWAQRHILAKKPFYVISASPYDMGKTSDKRSKYFLGKLKSKHDSRLFEGISYINNTDRVPIVAIVFEHERVQLDRKMEVAIPVNVQPADFLAEFSKIRYEGCQNNSSFSHLKFFHQFNDNPEYMASSESLNDFVSHEVAYATLPSSKNFQLITSHPFRSQYREPPNESQVISENSQAQAQAQPEIIFQFGKLDKHLFSCMYREPFTLLQAFMIILSRIIKY